MSRDPDVPEARGRSRGDGTRGGRGRGTEPGRTRGGRTSGAAAERREPSRADRAPSPPRNRRTPPPQPPRRRLRWRVPTMPWRPGAVDAARARLDALGARLARPAALAGRAVLAAAVVAGGVALVRAGERQLRASGAFAIEELEIEGHERLGRDDVLAAAGLAPGQNVLSREPAEVVAALEAHPWIASATAERRLPGTWQLNVQEHVPLAVLSIEGSCDDASHCEGGLFLLSRDGVAFKPVGPGDPVDYPVVTGLPLARFRDEPLWRDRTLLEVTALLHDWETVRLGQETVLEEVHVEEDGGLSVVVGEDGTLVRLGDPPHRPTLRRLDRVLTALARRQADPAYVLLDDPRHPGRATVGVRD